MHFSSSLHVCRPNTIRTYLAYKHLNSKMKNILQKKEISKGIDMRFSF